MRPGAPLTVLGGLAGWVLGSATGARSGFIALVGAVVAFEATTTSHADQFRAWRRVEILVLLVGVKVLHLVSVPRSVASAEVSAFPLGILDVESVTGWVVGISVWLLAVATVKDLAQIGTGVERAEEVPAIDRLRHRLIAATGLLVVAAALGSVGLSGLLDLVRPGERGIFWAAVAFLGLGLLGLARAAFENAEGRWERDGAAVDGPLRARWLGSGTLLVLLVVVVGLLSSVGSSGLSGAPAIGVSRMGPVGDWLVGAFERIGAGEARPQGEGGTFVSPLEGIAQEETGPGSLVGELFILAVLAMSVAVAMRAGGRSRGKKAPTVHSVGVLAAFLLSLVRGLRSLAMLVASSVWSALRAVFRIRIRKPGAMASRRRKETMGSIFWNPADPFRRLIAVAYRRFVGNARQRGVMRSSAETPREFAGRVGATDPVRRLTTAYEEARYSAHVLGPANVSDAEEAAASAIAEER